MAMNEALKQYLKCLECKELGSCKDVDEKIKAEWDKPMFPLKYVRGISGEPYTSKYFDDRRYDPPRPITLCDIEKAMLNLSGR